jgi:hypothetical protein
MTKYSVNFKNNSTMSGNACVYQTDPDITDPYVMSLAWFSKAAHPTTLVDFTWGVNYSFVWSNTGLLKPGVVFLASQAWDADLSMKNQVDFTYLANAHTFKEQRQGPKQGSLYINEEGSIPPLMASVGIGMSGSGTFVRQAQPNIDLVFTPHPEYWITFGSFVQGQVLDITEITHPAALEFPPNVYELNATLNKDNTWTVTPA